MYFFNIGNELLQNFCEHAVLYFGLLGVLYPAYLWNTWVNNITTKTPLKSKLNKLNKHCTSDYLKSTEFLKRQFLQIMEDPEARKKYNENIESIFYDAKTFKETMSSSNATSQALEKKWSQRVLMELTPYGNVSMYYDAYKKVFAYSCDQSISYRFLNTIAMRYVMVYRCIDFFIDSEVLGDLYKSPFVIQIETEEKEEKQKQKEKQNKIGIDFTNAPFLKPKTSKTSKTSNTTKTTNEQKQDTPIMYTNIFRNIGKMYQMPLLQKELPLATPKHIPEMNFEMNLDTIHCVPDSYAEFKRRQQNN